MLSSRTRFDLRTNAFSEAVAQERARGRDLIDLTISNPTTVGLGYPPAMLNALADERALVYAPEAFGSLEARKVVCEYLHARGVPGACADRTLLTASSSEAYAFLFKLLCDPGDDVLVPSPGYPLLDHLAALEGVALRSYPLRYDGRWHVDLAALDAAVGERTRAIVLVHPNNPTGSFVSLREMERVAALARRRALAIISDEVFAEYPYRDAAGAEPRAPSAANVEGVLSFSLGGLSKSAGLPQMKLGWTVVSGPDGVVRDVMSRLEVIADTFLSVGTPVQVALPRLLKEGAKVRAKIRRRVELNRRALAANVAPPSSASLLAAEGGWYAVLRVPRSHGEDDLSVRLVREEGVVVHPGWLYGFEDDGHVVLSLLPMPDRFREGTRRLLAKI